MSNDNESAQHNDANESLEESRSRDKWKCLSKESLTCLMLSSIVIGLPIAIIIILMNLPKLSTRGDTRQQHYILLAFGFPFSLVFIVSVLYGSFRIIMYFKKGSDDSSHLQSRLSWRHFSRRLRSRRFRPTDFNYDSELSASSRFYSLVNQVMAQNPQQVFPQNIDTNINEPYIQTINLMPFNDNHIKQSDGV
ncbi:uncharacterized protein LOC128963376 [Oppia nitens]|uniref:uncharacterized protein LOC128963376 n=1 Tax=Oppia nitens TaxID=1686743 RepID=UPI0023DBFC51|nr:uncharacterized protein LOC128963376 [Oppia nitens]